MLNDTWLGELLAIGESKVHHDLCVHLDRLSLKKIRPVLPLFHGIHRGGGKHRISGDEHKIDYVPFLADLRPQNYLPLDALFAGLLGVRWIDFFYQKARRHALGDTHANRRRLSCVSLRR